MNKLLTIVILFVMPSVIYSQVLTQHFAEGEAIKNGVKVSKRMTSNGIIEMPPVDVEKLLKEDAEMAGEDVPYRFGYGFETSYTLDNGEWDNEDEGRLWSLKFKSNGAISLNFVFEEFSLPDGAYLNIVNSDETIVYGPVTSENIPEDGYYLTDVIPDSSVTIYLWEPCSKIGKSTLKIKKVVHGYQNCYVINDDNGNPSSSAPCNIPVENGFPDYEKEANAVALIIMNDGTSYCSGSLVLSTDLSFKPYLLTAFHCVNTETYPANYPFPYRNQPTDTVASFAEKANVNHWAIKFGYRQQSTYAITFNGANFRSGWFSSDFALVELYENAKQFAHLTWLGWDRTGNIPSSEVGIHHPQGDYMKISIDNDPSQTSMWVESLYPNNGSPHWLEHWDSGIIQGGSSGSPLLNESKRVVGQLHGVQFEGNHTLETFLNSPCLVNYASYGKFHLSWSGGGHDYDRLSNWLDPVGTGQTTIDSSHPISIFGPVAPCNSDVYSVTNLPSGYNVIWSWHPAMNPLSNLEGTMGKKGLPLDSNLVFPPFPPIIEGITLMQNTPAANQCTIVIPSGTNALGTLKATIKKNGTTICVLEKNLDSSSGFYGTYTRTHVGSPTIGPNQFSSGSTIIANYGDVVTLQSPYFIDANISKTSTIPLSWTNNNGTISFTIPMNSQGGNSAATISFSGTNEDYCMSFGFTIYVNATDQLMAPTPDYELQVESEGQSYSFSMVPIEECKSDNLLNNPAISWELTIVNTNTGQIVYNRETTGSTLTINTESWKEGIYAARAVIGDDVITKKITYIIK